MTEEQLIKGCREGDRLAQKELYELHARKMLGVCMRYIDNKETAHDILQEGFVKVFFNLNSYQGNGSFEGWMRKIFVNCALEYLRHADVLRDSVNLDDISSFASDKSSAVADISAAELMKLIRELPAGFRAVFNMYAIDGYSHKDIAEKLGITESTSRSRFTRARQLLQQKVKALY